MKGALLAVPADGGATSSSRGTSEAHAERVDEVQKTNVLQPLRPGLLADGPNSHFFKSLMPSESRGH